MRLLACVLLILLAAGPAPGQAAAQPAVGGGVAVSDAAPAPLVEAGSRLEAVMFYLIGGLAAVSALGCVLAMNIVRMAVWLFATLAAVALLYFLMAASFLAAIQLIVYAGGTLIVIVFGIMLTSKSPFARFMPRPVEIIAGAAVCGALLSGLVVGLYRTPWRQAAGPDAYSVGQIGRELLTTYLVPFELASVLLLAVMIGAAYLARPERR